ncbi:MAG: acyl-CoA dehydratase activase-related protein [bacterium]|nr:acyl-CoA dehydratase activase-related protein [bacterium]
MATKIGIPRVLLYYKFFSFWKVFFEELRLEVVPSDETNREILKDSVNISVDEVCVPVKLIYGHTLNLRDKVDFLFIPRVISTEKRFTNCPKLLGLPDMVKESIDHLPTIIDTTIDYNRESLYKSMFKLGLRFTKNPFKINRAFEQAKRSSENHKGMEKTKLLNNNQQEGIKIAVLGHPYNIYDRFINGDLLQRLKRLNINVVTMDMVSKKILNRSIDSISRWIYWNYEREIYNSFYYFIKKVDGVINVISFSCGPDSLVGELLLRDAKRYEFPFLQLVIDEHTSETGIVTRLEAFVDMIKRKHKQRK